MIKTILALAAIMLATTALARVDVQCRVDGLERSVQFVTGSELNSATRSFSYNSFSVYALLWYSQDQVAILEHQGIAVGIHGDFDDDDLERLYRVFGRATFEQANGDRDTTYSIECKSFGRWIDSRLR